MGKIFLYVVGWFIGKFGLLLLLIAAMLLAPSVMEVWRLVGEFEPADVVKDIKKRVTNAVPVEGASKEQTVRKLKSLKENLEAKKAERDRLSKESCLLPTCDMVKDAKLYPIDMEIALIEQAMVYVEAISKGTKVCDERNRGNRQLNRLKVWDDELEISRPFWYLPSRSHRKLRERIKELESIQKVKVELCQRYQQIPKTFEANQAVAQKAIDDRYQEFHRKLKELKKAGSMLLQSVEVVLPAALLTLLGIIFVPLGVKLFAYYGVATLASRKFGVRLLPDTSGQLTVASASQYLQRIHLERGWELLIDPAILVGAPNSATSRTKWLLDWSIPLSSIASGQYLLTRIRLDDIGTVTISDNENGMSKITVLELPENAALVLQPRCLVGIVQKVDRPISITRPWRLGNIGSWLTLQLRYVVFHGPAKLIVRGNHGVEADAAQAGSSINQAATLGFSANLGYGVARCEPFYAYLSGKKELFNDCFSAGPGYYVQEVYPRPAKKTLLPGRGIEGILNSLLKIFGL